MEVISVTERYLRSIWSPFDDVAITTTLVPAGTFHVRIHEIDTKRKLYTKEGGFAIEKYRGGDPVPIEKRYQGEHSSIVLPWDVSHISDPLRSEGILVSPAPNLNLMFSTTVVPVLSLAIEARVRTPDRLRRRLEKRRRRQTGSRSAMMPENIPCT